MRASWSTGFAVIRRSGRSIRHLFAVGTGNPDRGKRGCLLEPDLPCLAQLQQRQERDGLVDTRQRAHLGVEVETASRAQHGAEALEELGDGREAQRHVRERDLRRRRSEQPQRRRELLRVLRGELALGPRRQRGRADAEVAVALAGETLAQPCSRLLHPAVLGEPPRKLLGRLLGLEVGQLGLLVREERARLQLEQRRDQDEELAAGLQVELVALSFLDLLGEPLDEGDHDRGHVDVRRLELLLQEQRQEQVEGALERVEVQLELAHNHGAREASVGVGRGRAGRPSPSSARRASGRRGGSAGPCGRGRTASR